MKDEWIETACLETNVMDCSSNWYVYSGGWYVDTNSYMYTCSGYDTIGDTDDGTIVDTSLFYTVPGDDSSNFNQIQTIPNGTNLYTIIIIIIIIFHGHYQQYC